MTTFSPPLGFGGVALGSAGGAGDGDGGDGEDGGGVTSGMTGEVSGGWTTNGGEA